MPLHAGPARQASIWTVLPRKVRAKDARRAHQLPQGLPHARIAHQGNFPRLEVQRVSNVLQGFILVKVQPRVRVALLVLIVPTLLAYAQCVLQVASMRASGPKQAVRRAVWGAPRPGLAVVAVLCPCCWAGGVAKGAARRRARRRACWPKAGEASHSQRADPMLGFGCKRRSWPTEAAEKTSRSAWPPHEGCMRGPNIPHDCFASGLKCLFMIVWAELRDCFLLQLASTM